MKHLKCIFIRVGPVVLISFVLCVLNQQRGHNWGGDFALYIHQTESLAEGTVNKLAVFSRYIIENTPINFSPVLYPWGLPILLLPVYYTFGIDYTAFKVLEAIFFMGAIVMIFLTFRKDGRLDFLYNFLLLCIMAFNILYIKHTNHVLSEIPFLCFSFIGLYFILKLLDNPVKEQGRWMLSILTGCILFFCFSIRTEGIGLFGALFIGQVQYLVRHKKNTKNIILPFILPYVSAFVLYELTSKWLPSGFLHHLSFTQSADWQAAGNNAFIYYNLLKTYMFAVPIFPYFIYIVMGLGLIGLLNRLKKDLVLAAFFVSQIMAFLLWPSTNLRYLYTLYPLFLYFFTQGLCFFYKKSRENMLIKFTGIFILWLCLTTNIIITVKATLISLGQASSTMYGPEIPESKEMFTYIRNSTQEDDVIAFFKPRVMHFYTDRLSLALFPNIEKVRELADYYVESKKVGNYFQVSIENTPLSSSPYLEKVFFNSEFNIYKVIK